MKKVKKPKIRKIEHIHKDLPQLIEVVQDLIDYLDGDPEEIHDDGYDDHTEWIYQVAISLIFGDDVWDWMNSKR